MTLNTVLLTLAYAYGGIRILMILDDASGGEAIAWMYEGEIRTWVGMIFWPLTLLFGLVHMLVEKSGTGRRA